MDTAVIVATFSNLITNPDNWAMLLFYVVGFEAWHQLKKGIKVVVARESRSRSRSEQLQATWRLLDDWPIQKQARSGSRR